MESELSTGFCRILVAVNLTKMLSLHSWASTYTIQKLPGNELLKELMGELFVGIDNSLIFKAQKSPKSAQFMVLNTCT